MGFEAKHFRVQDHGFGPESGRTGRAALALAGLILLSACGDSQGWPSDSATAQDSVEPAKADAATSQAALSLSVTSAGAELDTTGWTRAVQCTAAIEASAELVKRSPIVTQSQYQEIVRAGESFAQRATALAQGEGHSAQDTAAALATARSEAGKSPQAALRTTLGCIRSPTGGA